MKMKNPIEFIESKGYEFDKDKDDLWMEENVEMKWKDFFEYLKEFQAKSNQTIAIQGFLNMWNNGASNIDSNIHQLHEAINWHYEKNKNRDDNLILPFKNKAQKYDEIVTHCCDTLEQNDACELGLWLHDKIFPQG